MTAAVLGLDGHAWAATAPAPGGDEELAAAVLAEQPPAHLAVTARAAVPALVALVPTALARHDRLGVPPDVTRDTLLDVGRKIRAYGATTDVRWLIGLLRADVLALGRLQFERSAGREGRAVHVPELGPLRPDLVDDALARAAEVLDATRFTCTSWLLDPTLPRGLPATSNIVQFSRRFTVVPTTTTTTTTTTTPTADGAASAAPTPGDVAVAKFVFRRPLAEVLDPAAVVPRTRLERLVVRHLRSGQHWTEPRGLLATRQRVAGTRADTSRPRSEPGPPPNASAGGARR